MADEKQVLEYHSVDPPPRWSLWSFPPSAGLVIGGCLVTFSMVAWVGRSNPTPIGELATTFSTSLVAAIASFVGVIFPFRKSWKSQSKAGERIIAGFLLLPNILVFVISVMLAATVAILFLGMFR